MENSIAINVLNEGRTIIGTLDVIDADINVVYQLSDIRDPEKRKANYVRKFKLPGTKNNNRLFNSFHELGYQITDVASYSQNLYLVESGTGQSFNPNRKLISQVIVNGNIFFEGSLQINKINNVAGKIDYEATIYGTLADFFVNIENVDVSDLDFSEYNHIMNAKNILQSQWVPEGSKEVVWRTPSGYSSNQTIKNRIMKFGKEYENYVGDGYVYPLIYSGGPDLKTTVHVEKWQPAIYARTIWNKIFEKAGFRYKSQFLDSELFRRLIIPFGKDGLQVPQDVVDKSEFLANVGDTGNDVTGGTAPYYRYIKTFTNIIGTAQKAASPVKFDYDSTSGTSAIPAPRDPGNVFADSTTFTAPKNGKFRLQASLQPVIVFRTDQVVQQFVLRVNNQTADTPNSIPVTAKFVNSATKAVIAEKTAEINITNASYVTSVAFAGSLFLEWEGYLSQGTKIQIMLEMTNRKQVGNYPSLTYNFSGQSVATQQQLYIRGKLNDSSNFSARLIDYSVNDGDYVNMNQVAPDMGAVDFLTSINRLFNLYWVPTGKDREFAIEPKDKIYEGAKDKIYDWTGSIDGEENKSIQPLFNLVGNRYTFTYTEDSDYLNAKYKDQHKSVYGDRQIEIDNDFIDDNPEIKTGFSPTPLYTPPFNSGISLSGIFAQDGTKFKRHVPKTRILYWGGMKPYKAAFNDPREIWIDKFGADGKSTGAWIYKSIGAQIVYEFPYAGHLDDPYSPSIDLNYGVADEYYYSYTKLTANNLYNSYWRSTAEEILNPSQHLLTATINISAPEIAALDLRATIQVDNIYYRINKLTYDPVSEIGEVELFKTFQYESFDPSELDQGQAAMTPTPNPGQGAGTGTTTVINTKKETDIWNDDWTWRGGWSPWEESTSVWINGNEDYRPWRGSVDRPQWTAYTNTGRGSVRFGDLPYKGYTPIDQYDNFYPAAGDVVINGRFNNVSQNARFVTINGSNNTVLDSAENISIAGSFNTVMPGVRNVSVVGDNMRIAKSNTSYVDGAEISRSGISANAQTTAIKSPESIWDGCNGVISGGKNSNGSFVGRKAPIINANAPTPIPKNAPAQSIPPPPWENWMINQA